MAKLPKSGSPGEEEPMKESQIQRAIIDYLAARHILAFRMNSGSLRDKTGRPVQFGVPGMADILAFQWKWCIMHGEGSLLHKVKAVVPTWIEVKNEKGKQSELQKSFQAQVEGAGHVYLLARSLDDVIAALE